MGSLPRPKITAWVHGGVAARGSLHPCSWPPVALQKSLHGCAGSLQRRTRCVPAAGTRRTPTIVAWAHRGVAEWDSLHPSSCRCSHALHHKMLLHGRVVVSRHGTCCIPAAVAHQKLLHGCSVSLQHGTRCTPVPLAPQHPLHPSTNSSQCSLHPNTHCTQHPLHPKSCCTDGCCHCSTYCIWHPLHGHVVAVHQQPLHPTA